MNEATLSVSDMYMCVHGDTSHAGRLCYFIRLAGCNLQCSYCSRGKGREQSFGTVYSVDRLVQMVRNEDALLVEITGGEPLCQSGTIDLCKALLDNGIEVLLKTNGSLDISSVPPRVHRILECKLPSSGMASRNLSSNFDLLTQQDDVRFVIGTREDYDFALSVIRKYRLAGRTKNLLFTPVWEKIEPETLMHWILEDKPPVRLQLQMQKILRNEPPYQA